MSNVLANRPELLKAGDVAARLGVQRGTLSRWTIHGVRGVKLQPTRLGGRVYYAPGDVDAFVSALPGAAGAPPTEDDAHAAEPFGNNNHGPDPANLAFLRSQGCKV